MKIDRVEDLHGAAGWRTTSYLKIATSDGIVGWSEYSEDVGNLGLTATLRALGERLIGLDPLRIESILALLYTHSVPAWSGINQQALAAIGNALLDIKGKALGVPVYQLMGGKVRDRVPCYANAWFAGSKTPAQFAAKAKETIKLGFEALKWDPFGAAYLNLTTKEFELAMDCVAAVREAVGLSVQLLIEGHGRFNVPTAVRVGLALERFDIMWFEEPLPPGDLDGLAEVKHRLNIPIAAGERLYTRWDFRELLARKAADYLQPDISHCGGIWEARKIAAMAECHFLPVCPHNPIGAVTNAATLQLAACTPNFCMLETMSNDVPYRHLLTTEKVDFANGMMTIPDLPGLGIDIREDELIKHPYQPHNLRHYNGDLTMIRPAGAGGWYGQSNAVQTDL